MRPHSNLEHLGFFFSSPNSPVLQALEKAEGKEKKKTVLNKRYSARLNTGLFSPTERE